MTSTTRPDVRRVILVPAAPASSRGRGDEAIRRYRLARLRLEGRAGGSVRPASPPVDRGAVRSIT